MIKLIGTTHFTLKEEIIKIIEKEKPDVLGVELCKTRFKVLTNQIENSSKEKDESLIGQIAEATKKKAEQENLDYGSDMKTVMFYAINNNIPLMLVDKDILEIQKDMTQIPIEEQIYLQRELLKFQQEKLTKEINEEEVINKMKKDIPMTYKILVEDRNNFILKNIKEESKNYKGKKILIFLGKGHLKKVEEDLSKFIVN